MNTKSLGLLIVFSSFVIAALKLLETSGYALFPLRGGENITFQSEKSKSREKGLTD